MASAKLVAEIERGWQLRDAPVMAMWISQVRHPLNDSLMTRDGHVDLAGASSRTTPDPNPNPNPNQAKAAKTDRAILKTYAQRYKQLAIEARPPLNDSLMTP